MNFSGAGMPKVLRDISIHEVSAVDRGAGEGVRVLLMKRAGQRTEDKMPATLTEEGSALLAKLLKRDQKKAAKIAKREAAEKAMLPTEKAFYDALVEKSDRKSFRKMSSAERAAIVKAGKMPPPKKKPAPANDDNDDDDASKRLDKRIDDVAADTLAKANKDNAELRERLQKVEDERALQDAERDAVEKYGLQKSAGSMIMKARRGDKAAIADMEKALETLRKQRDEAVQTGGLFKELGSNGGNAAKTAYDELVDKANELKKVETKLTFPQAFDKVMTDPANAEIVKREAAERISKISRAA